MSNKENEEFLDQIEGRNSVIELLESDRDINKLYIAKGEKHGSINKIISNHTMIYYQQSNTRV
mgnify:CR=1 FL=1